MKKHFLIIATAIMGLALISCTINVDGESFGGETVKGNGNIVTRTYDVRDFENLSVLLPATVNFTVANDYSCTVRADDNLFEYLDIMVKGDELIMEKPKKYKDINLRPTQFVIDITAPSLDEISLAGSGTVNCLSPMNFPKVELFVAGSGDINFKEAASINHLEMRVAGSGDIRVPNLTAEKLEVDVAGSGDIKVDSGTIGEAEVSIAGSGDCVLSCVINVMQADIAGSGDIMVARVDGKLDYNIIGSGDISYGGEAVVNGKKVGSGSIKHVERQ